MGFNTAFIGLGTMGYPMAGHLVKAGHSVTVFNRTFVKAKAWQAQHGGRFAYTPALAAADADFIFTCVGNDDDLRAVTTGKDGIFNTARRGAVIVDHTTTSAAVARELTAEAERRGARHGSDQPWCSIFLADAKPLGNHAQQRIRFWLCG